MTEARPLPDPPTDGVSALSYLPPHPNPSLLASTSWDGCVRIHDTSAMAHRITHAMESGPLLSLATPEIGGLGSAIFAGGLNGSVRAYDIPTATSTTVGRHAGSSDVNLLACSCLATLDGLLPGGGATNRDCVVASAGWDSKFHLWDTRMSGGGGNGGGGPGSAAAAATVDLPGKAFSMDSNSDHAVVVATSDRRNVVIDVRMPLAGEEGTDDDATPRATLSQDRESSLKYQTRCVRFFPDGTGMALGSIEGRVAIEYLHEGVGDEKPKKKKYAFKCHRVGDTVYPVNAIAFHPRFGTFATGGCDGAVVVWDGGNKKRLTALAPKFATSVAALAFNGDGTELAVASSYTYEEGEREHPRDEVYVRGMLDEECRPKSKK